MSTRAYTIAAAQVTAAPVFYGVITAGSSVALQSRVTDDTGALLVPSSVTSVTATITDMNSGTVIGPITIAPNAAVSSTLNPWSVDGTGFNIAIQLDGSNFAVANTTYQVTANFVTTAGDMVQLWNVQTVLEL